MILRVWYLPCYEEIYFDITSNGLGSYGATVTFKNVYLSVQMQYAAALTITIVRRSSRV
jgi:hypothetical protein